MSSRSKSGKVRSAARACAAKPPGRQGRAARIAPVAWEQIALGSEEREEAIDCLRIVQGDSGRSLPLYYDDYN